MRALAILFALVGVAALVWTGSIAAQEEEKPINIRVVYDANNNGALDEKDVDLPDRPVSLAKVDVTGRETPVESVTTGKTGEAVSVQLEAGSYVIAAVGPAQLQTDAGDDGSICRGWRTSFVTGVSLSKDVEQPAGGFGFAIDIAAAASEGDTIVLGLSDKGAPGTEFEGQQVLCAEQGGDTTLPATGAPEQGGPSSWPRIALLAVAALIAGAVFLSRSSLLRRLWM